MQYKAKKRQFSKKKAPFLNFVLKIILGNNDQFILLNNQIYRDCNRQWPDESQPRYSLKMDHIVQ